MKLNIIERLALMRILPAESDFATVRIVRDIKKKLGFTAEEVEKWKINTVTEKIDQGRTISQVTWNKEEDTDADIKLVRVEREIIIKQLEELDNKKQASEIFVDLYDKVKEFHEKLEKKG